MKHLCAIKPWFCCFLLPVEKGDDTIVISAGGSVPNYLLFDDLKLCLKHLSREVIRKHLLKLDLHEHLFGRVPRLELPTSLTDFLLYGMSIDNETKHHEEVDHQEETQHPS